MALDEIAERMRQYAIEHPRRVAGEGDIAPYQEMLEGGLHLTLILTPAFWRLSVARRYFLPGIGELAEMKKAFGVPAEAREEKVDVSEWRVVRLSWPPQEKLFELEPIQD